MKHLLVNLITILWLSSILTSPVKANPWLVLEGVSLGAQGLIKIKEKITDFNQDRKKKKQNSQKQFIEISDEILEINPDYIKTLSKEEKTTISKSYYKSANKNFKKKNIIRGCAELYQVILIDISDVKFLKKIKKKVNKYDCTKYDFVSKASSTTKKIDKTTQLERMVSNINNQELTSDYYIFAHSTSGKTYWGSTTAKDKKTQIGNVFSSPGYACQIVSKMKNKTAPFKGSFSLKCPNEKINGTWVQRGVYTPGFGTASIPNGTITAYFSRSKFETIQFVEKYYGKTKNTQIAKKQASQTDKLTESNSNRLCVSKSFNTDYRFTNNICKDDEKEIPKGSDEYYEAQAYMELKNDWRKEFELVQNKKEPSKTQKSEKKRIKLDKEYVLSLPSNRIYYNWDNNESAELFYRQLSNISQQPNLNIKSKVWISDYNDKKGKDHWNNKYPKSGGAKAWAQSKTGAWAWRTGGTKLSAAKKALDSCTDYVKNLSYGGKCVVVKVNDEILTYEEQNYYSIQHYGLPTIFATIIKENEKIQLAKKGQIPKKEIGKTKEVIDGKTYDWVAITKHPKKDTNFIATKLSTKKKAIDFAMMKCYKYVTNSLSKRGYNDCSLVKVYNEKNKDTIQLVKKQQLKQNKNNDILFSVKDNFNFDTSKDLWHAIVVHKTKANIYRSDISPKINTKDKAINNAKSKCWFDPQYTSGDWPSENCVIYYVSDKDKIRKKYKLDNKIEKIIVKKKLAEEINFIKNPKKILSKGITLEFLGLEQKTYVQLKKNKIKKEADNIDKYLNANLNGSDLKEFNLENETLKLVKVKRQERKEELYAKTCTGIIFGYKKGTKDWYKCLDEEEAKFIPTDNKTTIVKKEKTVTPEKKTKVVKAKDINQEEFKPKKTNQDNEAPVITIAEAITVNDANYEIEGKVSDSSKNIFITVDGRTIPVTKGKFSIKRFSPVDEQIEIIAIDQWGNRSQPKLVNITIDQQETIVANIFENLDPSKIKTRSNKNRVALIIGIEKYDQTPEASYANLDAKYFYEYVRKGFGVSKANIKLLVDEDANLIQSLGTLNKWLPGKIKDGKTELIIFFAGHGLASSDGKELYLLPQDSDPDLLARTALSRTELFQQIIALNPKSVTMFLDTCYSGISRDEKTLLASARPVRILANDQDTPNNFTIFSASQLDQISSGLKEANHGIFSYYLMKGLEGKADNNKDKKITNGELLAYMDQNVSQKASELGRQQNPSLAGDPNKILMSYR